MAQAMQSRSEMQECIDACRSCHDICLNMAMTHCLEMGGRHVEPDHFQLLLNCAELCQTTANFILSNSSVVGAVSEACAQVCAACARSCEQIGNMGECATACLHCADSCTAMAPWRIAEAHRSTSAWGGIAAAN